MADPIHIPVILRPQLNSSDLNKAAQTLRAAFSSSAVGEDFVKSTRAIDQGVKSVNTLTKSLSAAKRAAFEFGETAGSALRWSMAYRMATKTVYGFIEATGRAVKSAFEFEKQMIRISQISGKSMSQLSKFGTQVEDLAIKYGQASKELAQAAVTLHQTGMKTAEVFKTLSVIAKSQLLPTFDSIEDSTQGAIAIMNQFNTAARENGKALIDLERAFGALNAVAKNFAVESSDIITAVRRAGGVFASLASPIDDANTALNKFSALTTSIIQTTRESADRVGTAMKTIFGRLQRPKVIDDLRAYGIDLRDAAGEFIGPFEAIQKLGEGLNKLQINNRMRDYGEIIEKLGGLRQIGRVIPLLQQTELQRRALRTAKMGEGSLDEDAAKALEGTLTKLVQLQEAFNKAIREMVTSSGFGVLVRGATDLLTILTKVSGVLTPLITGLTVLSTFRLAAMAGPYAKGFGTGLMGGALPRSKKVNILGMQGLSSGGKVHGVGDSDTVPAVLSPGEFVLKRSAAKALGSDTLNKLNALHFSDGGAVPSRKELEAYLKKHGISKTGSNTYPFDRGYNPNLPKLPRATGMGGTAQRLARPFDYATQGPYKLYKTTPLDKLRAGMDPTALNFGKGDSWNPANASRAPSGQFAVPMPPGVRERYLQVFAEKQKSGAKRASKASDKGLIPAGGPRVATLPTPGETSVVFDRVAVRGAYVDTPESSRYRSVRHPISGQFTTLQSPKVDMSAPMPGRGEFFVYDRAIDADSPKSLPLTPKQKSEMSLSGVSRSRVRNFAPYSTYPEEYSSSQRRTPWVKRADGHTYLSKSEYWNQSGGLPGSGMYRTSGGQYGRKPNASVSGGSPGGLYHHGGIPSAMGGNVYGGPRMSPIAMPQPFTRTGFPNVDVTDNAMSTSQLGAISSDPNAAMASHKGYRAPLRIVKKRTPTPTPYGLPKTLFNRASYPQAQYPTGQVGVEDLYDSASPKPLGKAPSSTSRGYSGRFGGGRALTPVSYSTPSPASSPALQMPNAQGIMDRGYAQTGSMPGINAGWRQDPNTGAWIRTVPMGGPEAEQLAAFREQSKKPFALTDLKPRQTYNRYPITPPGGPRSGSGRFAPPGYSDPIHHTIPSSGLAPFGEYPSGSINDKRHLAFRAQKQKRMFQRGGGPSIDPLYTSDHRTFQPGGSTSPPTGHHQIDPSPTGPYGRSPLGLDGKGQAPPAGGYPNNPPRPPSFQQDIDRDKFGSWKDLGDKLDDNAKATSRLGRGIGKLTKGIRDILKTPQGLGLALMMGSSLAADAIPGETSAGVRARSGVSTGGMLGGMGFMMGKPWLGVAGLALGGLYGATMGSDKERESLRLEKLNKSFTQVSKDLQKALGTTDPIEQTYTALQPQLRAIDKDPGTVRSFHRLFRSTAVRLRSQANVEKLADQAGTNYEQVGEAASNALIKHFEQSSDITDNTTNLAVVALLGEQSERGSEFRQLALYADEARRSGNDAYADKVQKTMSNMIVGFVEELRNSGSSMRFLTQAVAELRASFAALNQQAKLLGSSEFLVNMASGPSQQAFDLSMRRIQDPLSYARPDQRNIFQDLQAVDQETLFSEFERHFGTADLALGQSIAGGFMDPLKKSDPNYSAAANLLPSLMDFQKIGQVEPMFSAMLAKPENKKTPASKLLEDVFSDLGFSKSSMNVLQEALPKLTPGQIDETKVQASLDTILERVASNSEKIVESVASHVGQKNKADTEKTDREEQIARARRDLRVQSANVQFSGAQRIAQLKTLTGGEFDLGDAREQALRNLGGGFLVDKTPSQQVREAERRLDGGDADKQARMITLLEFIANDTSAIDESNRKIAEAQQAQAAAQGLITPDLFDPSRNRSLIQGAAGLFNTLSGSQNPEDMMAFMNERSTINQIFQANDVNQEQRRAMNTAFDVAVGEKVGMPASIINNLRGKNTDDAITAQEKLIKAQTDAAKALIEFKDKLLGQAEGEGAMTYLQSIQALENAIKGIPHTIEANVTISFEGEDVLASAVAEKVHDIVKTSIEGQQAQNTYSDGRQSISSTTRIV